MPTRPRPESLSKDASLLRRIFTYAFYDWTREMTPLKRGAAWSGIFLQGWAVWAATAHAVPWDYHWPTGLLRNLAIAGVYLVGYCITNATLTSELVRKTQLETDQAAARKIQQTLIPQLVEAVPGYEVATYYQPFREVGGDYFDVIPLAGDGTLFVIADVSGKGVSAALLSANIQALVRSRTQGELDLAGMAEQISQHVNQYTPAERYATAAFILLHRTTGEVTYVNAGHNPPMIAGAGSARLTATGVPLGLLPGATYETATATLPPGGALLLYTDGLTDSVAGDEPEDSVRAALTGRSKEIVERLKTLIQPKLSADDVTLVVVRRS